MIKHTSHFEIWDVKTQEPLTEKNEAGVEQKLTFDERAGANAHYEGLKGKKKYTVVTVTERA